MSIQKTTYVNHDGVVVYRAIYEAIPDTLDAMDYPCDTVLYYKSGMCVEFFPNKKVKEIANYSSFMGVSEKRSFRAFNQSGKIIEEKESKDPEYRLPSLSDLSDDMKNALQKEGLWKNVVSAFERKSAPKPRVISKHSRRQSSGKKNTKTR